MTKLFVTGAGGFLGNALVRRWAEAGHEVHALVRPSSNGARLDFLSEQMSVHVAADATAAARVLADVRPEAVVHTACAYGRGGETAAQIFDANLALGLALLQAILNGDEHVSFLNAGSALDPRVSLYALSKRQFSDWGSRLAEQFPGRLRFVDLRTQHMYGPGDDRSKFTTHVLHACHANVPELPLTGGEQERDFVHIDDVVSAYDTILAQCHTMPANDAIDVGSGVAPRIQEFVELVRRLTGASTHLAFGVVPYRPQESMRCVADTIRLRSLGWRPRHDLISGLQDTLRREFAT